MNFKYCIELNQEILGMVTVNFEENLENQF